MNILIMILSMIIGYILGAITIIPLVVKTLLIQLQEKDLLKNVDKIK